MNNNRIRLTESQLHNVIKESVMRVLQEELMYEESYRKAAKKGDHTCVANKHALNYMKKMGYDKTRNYTPKNFHKWAKDTGFDKTKRFDNGRDICSFEDDTDWK